MFWCCLVHVSLVSWSCFGGVQAMLWWCLAHVSVVSWRWFLGVPVFSWWCLSNGIGGVSVMCLCCVLVVCCFLRCFGHVLVTRWSLLPCFCQVLVVYWFCFGGFDGLLMFSLCLGLSFGACMNVALACPYTWPHCAQALETSICAWRFIFQTLLFWRQMMRRRAN